MFVISSDPLGICGQESGNRLWSDSLDLSTIDFLVSSIVYNRWCKSFARGFLPNIIRTVFYRTKERNCRQETACLR